MKQTQKLDDEIGRRYYSLPISFFKEGDTLDKDLYLSYQGNFILFQKAGCPWAPGDNQKLADFSVAELYIKVDSSHEYCEYVDTRMKSIIEDSGVAQDVKGRLVYSATVAAADGLLKQPESIDFARQNISFVKHCVNFLGQDKQGFYEIFKASSQDMAQHSHGLHVAVYAVTLAKHLGFKAPDELTTVAIGGMLIDIGKTKIPKEILAKPGKLSNPELFEIRKHPQYGHEITAKYSNLLPNLSRVMIIQHHEQCDGQGYPKKLTSDRIHIFSKIVRIADMFDAMTSDRPWRGQLGAMSSAKELLDKATTIEEKNLILKFIEMMK
jgi:HD-GYP domain-containing protein (c-di-GMP phosphodiesterase class II)